MKSALFAQPAAQQAETLFQQAMAQHQQGLLAEALHNYLKVTQLQPRHFNALNLGGVVALQMGQAQQAVDLLNKAAKIEREHAGVYLNRGTAYQQLGELDLALINFNKAVSLAPDNGKAYANRGTLLTQMQRPEEALADFDRALAIQDDHVPHNSRGLALGELQRHEEGLHAFERAVALAPDSVDAHWNLGMALLRLGQFERGWLESEWRLQRPAHIGLWAEQPAPRWQGEALEGRTILLRHEQGLGDTIQFARYVPLVQARGGRVLLQVQAPLKTLLSDLPGVAVFATDEPLPAFDCHCPLLSLPRLFQTDLGSMPAPVSKLLIPEATQAHWQALLGERQRPRVGLAWSGNTAHVDDAKRSLAFAQLATVLGSDIDWVVLQKDIRSADQTALAQHPHVCHFGAQLNDFTDTAALCNLMDVVVSVDTSVAHLAATLGKPTWIMLAHNPDWRWLLAREDSPWYPAARLYRQSVPGDWAGMLQKIRADLSALFITP
ncbi:tetratricopeptide repeat protein [Aquabacterium sp.]|uniref:tetratricopeptide repeat protein n=1 Tax=Aquabacterium sp. TaxID=1872578 RepID=UPI0035B26063